jgi:L-asparaginase / beta-aspartyl-peptidase
MDASIMNGADMKAGAVAGVTTVKNPIDAARLVMDSSDNVLLAGSGAEKFAAMKGAAIVDRSYFFTQDSWDELIKAKEEKKEPLPVLPGNNGKFGTVGAVALDKAGNLSAGTSTGGRNNKRFGRIGDSPIIGASTYADNRYCAVSSTGWGEFFIRHAAAHSVVSCMELAGTGLADAAQWVMYQKMKGIEGGIIALDKNGHASFPFNTPVMNRGYITLTGEPQVFIYK